MWCSINSFSFISWLFSTPQTSLQCLGKLTAMQGIVRRWIWFLWWNWCNIFNGLCSGTIRVLYLVKFIVFESDFYTYLSVFLVEISSSLVCGEQMCLWKCLSSLFCFIGPYYVESCMFIKQIFLGRTTTSISYFFCPSVCPSVCRTSYLRNSTSFNHYFLVYQCKMMISPGASFF